MFITIHQIDELWFKLALRELVHVRDLFAQEKVREQSLASAVRGIRRTALLFEHGGRSLRADGDDDDARLPRLSRQAEPGERLPVGAAARDRDPARASAIEERMPLGHDTTTCGRCVTPTAASRRRRAGSRRRLARHARRCTRRSASGCTARRSRARRPEQPDDEAAGARFLERYLAPRRASCDAATALAMAAAPPGEADRQRLEPATPGEANARAFLLADDACPSCAAAGRGVRAALLFIESYRELPLLAWPREVLDAIVELEQAFVIFRQRHARMVERVVGRRTGTGGSAGVDYLDQTALRYRIFRDLWATRTLLVRKSALPPVETPDAYVLGVGQ
jgi:tryptophan 2,3-dioxygenase